MRFLQKLKFQVTKVTFTVISILDSLYSLVKFNDVRFFIFKDTNGQLFGRLSLGKNEIWFYKNE
jgi:hypothetical protein